MPKRRGCAKSMSASNNDLNMLESWLLALESVMGLVVPLVALVWSTLGRNVENAAVRWLIVLVSIVPACSMCMATMPPSLNIARGPRRGGRASRSSSRVSCRIQGLKGTQSLKGRVCITFVEVGLAGLGVSGTPLAYMRSGAVPWPPSWRACVSSGGSTQGSIRPCAAVRSAS